MKLEDIKNGANVAGVVPNQSVEVVSVDWIGDQALNLVYRIPGGSVSETTLYRDDEHRLLECFLVHLHTLIDGMNPRIATLAWRYPAQAMFKS